MEPIEMPQLPGLDTERSSSGAAKPRRRAQVYQYLVVLRDTDPLVWRRIQVPERYSFWDLHVPIQDAMGWQDYHLHEFQVFDVRTNRLDKLGIPDDEFPSDTRLTGWEVPIKRYPIYNSPPMRYLYDFGDDWQHVVDLEEVLTAEPGKYPRCVAGGGACPPEDVGGTDGYRRFLEVIRDLDHEEREEWLTWIVGSFDPEAFSPSQVRFENPRKRWKIAFTE